MTQEFKFNVRGQERKALAGAVSEILNTPVNYLGAPTFAYTVGDYHIDKDGTITGKHNLSLMVGLEQKGFEPEPSKTFHLITPRSTLLIQERFDTAAEAEAAGYDNYFHHEGRDVYVKAAPDGKTEHSKWFAVVGAPFEKAPEPETPTTTTDPDQLSVDIPLEGFTPEAIENLRKLVDSKAALIKKALGAEALPIEVLDDRISFPWFKADTDGEHVTAYAQFIAALCNTAKEKKRVTAKAQESFENEKFTLRVWLIGLGMVGKEYALARKLLLANLDGNSSWRYGAPEKAAHAPEAAEEAAPVEETEVGADD